MGYQETDNRLPIKGVEVVLQEVIGPQDLSHDEVVGVLGLGENRSRLRPELPTRKRLVVSIMNIGDEEPTIIDCTALTNQGNASQRQLDRLRHDLAKHGLTPEKVLAQIKC